MRDETATLSADEAPNIYDNSVGQSTLSGPVAPGKPAAGKKPADYTTPDFFNHVLPSNGKRCAAEFKRVAGEPDGERKPFHRFFDTNEQLAKAVLRSNAAGEEVYFAISGFKTAANRTQANVKALRVFPLDLDVGEGKGFANKNEALKKFTEFRKKLNLPKPCIVDSGNGYHGYQVMSEDRPGDVEGHSQSLKARLRDFWSGRGSCPHV